MAELADKVVVDCRSGTERRRPASKRELAAARRDARELERQGLEEAAGQSAAAELAGILATAEELSEETRARLAELAAKPSTGR